MSIYIFHLLYLNSYRRKTSCIPVDIHFYLILVTKNFFIIMLFFLHYWRQMGATYMNVTDKEIFFFFFYSQDVLDNYMETICLLK